MDLELIDKFFHTLYAFACSRPEELSAQEADAFKKFVHAYKWIYPLKLPRKLKSPFMVCAEQHERVTPQTFNGDAIVAKYFEQAYPPTVWGPPLWHLLHKLAEREDYHALKNALEAVEVLIPCSICQGHLKEMLKQHPVPRRGSLKQYMVDIHNQVNKRLGKAQYGIAPDGTYMVVEPAPRPPQTHQSQPHQPHQLQQPYQGHPNQQFTPESMYDPHPTPYPPSQHYYTHIDTAPARQQPAYSFYN